MHEVTMKIALDMYKSTALLWALVQGTDHYGIGPSLAALLEAHPDYEKDLMEKAFMSLCRSGEWPGSRPSGSLFKEAT